MVSKSQAAAAARLQEVVDCQEINQSLRNATYLQSPKDWGRFAKISNHTPVIFYLWSPHHPPCRFVGPILDQVAGAAGDSVMLVAYETSDPKEFKSFRKDGFQIPLVAAMHGGVLHRGYLVNGGRDDDQVLIEIDLELLPPGDFRDPLDEAVSAIAESVGPETKKERGLISKAFRATAAVGTMGGSLAVEAAAKKVTSAASPDKRERVTDTSAAFYVDLLATKEGPRLVADVFQFALSLALGDAYEAVSSLEAELGNGVDAASEPEAVATEDPLDQLKKLSELHEAGILSDEEFEAKKRDLLDKI